MAIPDELHTTDDVIQEDNFETISNDTATVTDPFNQHVSFLFSHHHLQSFLIH